MPRFVISAFDRLRRYRSYHERSFARWHDRPFDFVALNKAAITEVIPPEHQQALVIDASFIPKRGAHAYGLDHFWNSRHQRREKGLEVSAVAWLDVTDNCAVTPICAISTKDRSALDADGPRIMTGRACPELDSGSAWTIAHVLSGCRAKTIPSCSTIKSSTTCICGVIYASCSSWTPTAVGKRSCSAPILTWMRRRFIVATKHASKSSFSSETPSSLLSLSAFQARSQAKLHVHFNASMSALTLGKLEAQQQSRGPRSGFSMASVKRRAFNQHLLERISQHLAQGYSLEK